MSIAYFGRPGLPAQLRDVPLEYFRDALQLLAKALPSRQLPTLTLGISRGSEAALLSAVHFPDLVDGVVVTVPGNVVLCGWPPGGPAWLLGGQPLPYVERFGPICEDPAALIPAEKVRGSILLISAGADRVWPSAAMARAISDRLKDRGHSFDHELAEYPDAGHSLGSLVPVVPGGGSPQTSGDSASDRVERSDAWLKTLEFIRRCQPAGSKSSE